jgi:hypothetical protein
MSKEMVDRESVDRIVALMESKLGADCPPLRPDLKVVRPLTARERATEAWQWHDANSQIANFSDIDQSPRARNIREINRIAMRRGWAGEVARVVDAARATSLDAMDDDAIEGVVQHMRHLVDCAETACDPTDDFPAR